MASVGETQAKTQAALEAALASHALSGASREQADALLERLNTRTRISLLGLNGSGKSGILNLLAGSNILPQGLSLSTLQLVHGEKERAEVTLADGSRLTLDAPLEISRIAAMNPAFIKIEAPLAALKKISLLEVATPEDRVAQMRAVQWAMKQTDIAIWCTQQFNAAEQALWASIPDKIKDHAILAVTQADKLGDSRMRVLQALVQSVGSEFAHVMAISTEEATAAKSAPGGINKAALKASGAMQLISTILRQIENGRQFAVDQAEVLMHKHKDAIANPPTVVETAPVGEGPFADSAAANTTTEPVVEDTVETPTAEATVDTLVEAVEAAPERPIEAPVEDTAEPVAQDLEKPADTGEPLEQTAETFEQEEEQAPPASEDAIIAAALAQIDEPVKADPVPEPQPEPSPEPTALEPAPVSPEPKAVTPAEPARTPEPAAAPEPVEVAPQAAAHKVVPTRPRSRRNVSEIAAVEEAPVQNKPAAVASEEFIFNAQPAPVHDEVDADREGLRFALREAEERLREAGNDLLAKNPLTPGEVLDRSVRAITWLCEYLQQETWPESQQLENFRTMAQEAEDLVQLLQIEGGEEGALDAVTTMLQLKRGFQAELAA